MFSEIFSSVISSAIPYCTVPFFRIDEWSMLLRAFAVSFGIKLILIPAYASTDFEVHRNWLAITHSLPLRKWYTDKTSEWTLDYPPLFAWFQYILSILANLCDKKMLVLTNLKYYSRTSFIFMRLTVMLTDLVLLYGCKKIQDFLEKNRIRKCSRWRKMWSSPLIIVNFLILCNMGLYIVDHIHFQYNGMLFGILLASVGETMLGNYYVGALLFAVLLNMKHIFLYMAPAYCVYLLTNFCFYENNNAVPFSTSLRRTTDLAGIVLMVSAVSFGPFIIAGQFKQVISRLFPFQRGLCHSYWAPNFWALYNILDKLLAASGRFYIKTHKYGFLKWFPYLDNLLATIVAYFLPKQRQHGTIASTIQMDYEHLVLPRITPFMAAILVLISVVPCLWKLWVSPGNSIHLVRSLILSTCCAFIFGWHVHEKAILMVIIPLSIIAPLWPKEAESYTLLSTVGHYSLLPLLFTPHEFCLKFLLFLVFTFYTRTSLTRLFKEQSRYLFPLLNIWENLYLFGLLLIFVYEHFVHAYFGIDKKYPSLALLITSGYCALGIIYFTIKYYVYFMGMDEREHKQKIF